MIFRTVRGLMPKIIATSGLVFPWATQNSTSASRRLRPTDSSQAVERAIGSSSNSKRCCPSGSTKSRTTSRYDQFERNLGALQTFNPADDMPLKLMELYELRPACALEIGAANGFRLAAIRERYGARVVAVELVVRAVVGVGGEELVDEVAVELHHRCPGEPGLPGSFGKVVLDLFDLRSRKLRGRSFQTRHEIAETSMRRWYLYHQRRWAPGRG